MAAPLYSYNSPDMKPFHLSANYQVYDANGQPGETGTFDYWYASPTVNRATWKRGEEEHSIWHTADGKTAHQGHGESLRFFETKLVKAWFAPLPDLSEPAFSKDEPERHEVDLKGGGKLECVELVPPMPLRAKDRFVAVGWFPTYCFDEHLPALRVAYSFGGGVTEFNHVTKFRDKYLPKQIVMLENGRRILSADLVTVTSLSADDAALTPPADAQIRKSPEAVNATAGFVQGMLVKKVRPVYPDGAKLATIAGEVELQALIGKDGRIHDLHVMAAPSPSLAAAALTAVAQWEYKPYLVNGEPVEVHTTIHVIFSLGG